MSRARWQRSSWKTFSYSLIHYVITVAVAYVFFGSLAWAGAFGLADIAIDVVAYYLHERVWAHVTLRKEVKRCVTQSAPSDWLWF